MLETYFPTSWLSDQSGCMFVSYICVLQLHAKATEVAKLTRFCARSCAEAVTTRSCVCPAQKPTASRTSTATGSVEASPPQLRSVWLRAHPATLTAPRSSEHASSTRSPTLRPTSTARQCCHLRQSGSVPPTGSPGRKQGQPLVGRPPSRLRVAATSLTQQAEAAALRPWKWAPSSCLTTARTPAAILTV